MLTPMLMTSKYKRAIYTFIHSYNCKTRYPNPETGGGRWRDGKSTCINRSAYRRYLRNNLLWIRLFTTLATCCTISKSTLDARVNSERRYCTDVPPVTCSLRHRPSTDLLDNFLYIRLQSVALTYKLTAISALVTRA